MAFPFGGVSPRWRDRFSAKFYSAFLGALRGKRGIRRGVRATPRRRAAVEPPQVLFESLEQRYLLSADLSPLTVAMLDAGHNLTLHLDGTQLEVTNDQTGQVVGQQEASRTSQVQIVGSGQNDRLTIEVTAGFALPF